MSLLNWNNFDSLPGSKHANFEDLCYALISQHFRRYGQFTALRNQPGVEFHLKLLENCPQLGEASHWYGWQCKWHELTSKKELKAASRRDIEDSIKKTEEHLPNLTDWVLWTPYILASKDQEWFNNIQTKFNLHLWSEREIDIYLDGPGLFFRETYFGDLIVTPDQLEQQHKEAVQPIRERWLESVHQVTDAERSVRQMLGEASSWDTLIVVERRLKKAADILLNSLGTVPNELRDAITLFCEVCTDFSEMLSNLHNMLERGNLNAIQQNLCKQEALTDAKVHFVPRRLRTLNLSVSLYATNALDDMYIAQSLANEIKEFLEVGLVAILADAGNGKTQMAAQLTSQQESRPAGILLHGRNLHKGQTLDDLARHFSIRGNPLNSIERLLVALDSAGKRANCRLPMVIDGLNEAENPRDWKNNLARLNEVVRRYPNVLVVCTLRIGEHQMENRRHGNNRESFAFMALPSDIKKIESKGFGKDTGPAIRKYFDHFKIDVEGAGIPIDWFQNPLALRIFCQGVNPKREVKVKIDYFPASFSILLEKYVVNACERISQMPNLHSPYTVADVKSVIYKLGLKIWEAKKREIDEESFRVDVGDTDRPWDSSIVNLLVQEGIIFRNSTNEPGKYIVTPVYDALGGFIVSNSLIDKHRRDMTFEWLKNLNVIELFIGQNTHELATDIFKSLVAITPRQLYGRQVWKEAPEKLRNMALLYTTEIEAKYLDQDTVANLLELMNNNSRARRWLFSNLFKIREASNHPFNAEFLDKALRAMPIVERDLSWTEWVRKNHIEILQDILTREEKWKSDLSKRTESDRLYAKWIMWLLTSTDHDLRDVATRTLYWFGRGDSKTLFDETLNALGINDPYVPERMLAASYGIAMANHVDMDSQIFVTTTLPQFSQGIYEAMFAKEAPCSTIHFLTRDYGSRIIEMSNLHNPDLFSSEEIQRSNPPFEDGAMHEWGESDFDQKKPGLESPFRMDFENYTIGRLVSGRGNYDYSHDDYRHIRAQILWRVEQIGWSSELFSNIDQTINNDTALIRMAGKPKKIDRYGKKYSWIAFFEMAGFLNDLDKLDRMTMDESGRLPEIDIDPSFPEPVLSTRIIHTNFLGDHEMDTEEWIKNGPSLDLTPYRCLPVVQDKKGPWIALYGYVQQLDEERQHLAFSLMRSFLIPRRDADRFEDSLTNLATSQNFADCLGMENPSVCYTFAGEIPWCSAYQENGFTKFSSVSLIQRTFPDFDVLIPVCDFNWEGSYSVANNRKRAIMLAKDIALELGLIGQPQTFDMFTDKGEKATCQISYRNDNDDDFHDTQLVIFMREKLLRKYLEDNDLTLIWAIWGTLQYYGHDDLDVPSNGKVFNKIKRLN